MFTGRTPVRVPGTFAPNRSEMPSSGWMRKTSRLGVGSVPPISRNRWRGGVLNEIATSVEEHNAIVRAIDAGDPPAAQQAVDTNWRNAAQRLSRVIDSLGERGSW